MGDCVLSCKTYVFQLLSVLFWIFWIQFKNVKVSCIQPLRQFYEMDVSVFEGHLSVYIVSDVDLNLQDLWNFGLFGRGMSHQPI